MSRQHRMIRETELGGESIPYYLSVRNRSPVIAKRRWKRRSAFEAAVFNPSITRTDYESPNTLSWPPFTRPFRDKTKKEDKSYCPQQYKSKSENEQQIFCAYETTSKPKKSCKRDKKTNNERKRKCESTVRNISFILGIDVKSASQSGSRRVYK